MRLDLNGLFRKVELYGPSSFATWEMSWDVYVTAMIMFGAISRPTLASYHRMMKHYSNRYGD